MESRMAQALQLKYNPVAVLIADRSPENAMRFIKGRFGCVMFLFANVAKGRTAAFDAETYGCWGGGVGLGFGNAYKDFPGGVECFCDFLSAEGNQSSQKGQAIAQAMEGKAMAEFRENFLYGEGYKKTSADVNAWIDELPMTDLGSRFVVFKPLSHVDPNMERPESVTFVANPDQLSALVILANYDTPGRDNVTIPWAAGCQLIGLLPWAEAKSDNPRAVAGLTDISARKNVRKLLDRDSMTFSMPWEMFLRMENNVDGSFLERHTWRAITAPA